MKFMNHILKPCIWSCVSCVVVYFDNILVHSKSEEEHIHHLKVSHFKAIEALC